MKNYLIICALAALVLVANGNARAQTTAEKAANVTAQAQTQSRVVGEVTAIDATARQVTVKTEDGKSVVVSTIERTAVLRLPPGEATAEKAVKITLADINAGDRLFARGEMAADGNSLNARQVVVTSSKGGAQAAAAGRDERPRPGINGRITAINPQTKEITLATRSRDGAGSITLAANGNVRFLHYAADSIKLSDATPGSFADLKVGDQVRARGETNADGTRFVPEEIVAGSIIRTGGTVTAVNAASNELTVKNNQTGQTMTVIIGARSSLRRIPPEVAATLAQRRVQDGAGRNGATNNGPANNGQANTGPASPRADGARGAGRRGERGNGGGGGGGRNFQEMFDSLPLITLADLKKGDAVFIIGTPGNSASRATAATLITGDAEFLDRLQQFQGRPNRDGRNASPGLPGDVLGGGGANRDQPSTPPRRER
jgi:Cu/Ag efflux protein CusF